MKLTSKYVCVQKYLNGIYTFWEYSNLKFRDFRYIEIYIFYVISEKRNDFNFFYKIKKYTPSLY